MEPSLCRNPRDLARNPGRICLLGGRRLRKRGGRHRPASPAVRILAAIIIVIAVIDVSITHASTGGTIGANSVILLGVLAAVTDRRAFAGLTPISDNYLAQFAAAAAAAEQLQAIRSVEERRISPVRNKVLPFLKTVKGIDENKSHNQGKVHDASELHRWARQHLSLPDFFDDHIRHLMEEAASRGIVIHVTGENPRGAAVHLGAPTHERCVGRA